MNPFRVFQKIGPPVLAVILLLAAWQGAAVWWEIPSWMLPGPLQILKEGLTGWARIRVHTLSTFRITLLGFVIGSSFGLGLAIVLHLVPGFKRAFYPLLILSQNIPTIVLAPLLMIWFGLGLGPKIMVITLVCFFPVVVAVLDGFLQADNEMMRYMKMIGANRRQVFFKLELPNALPSLFSGLKISATYSVMGAVVAEWLGSEKGIGVYMLLSRAAFRTDRVFVAIFIIVLLSLFLFGLIALLEAWFIRWKPKR